MILNFVMKLILQYGYFMHKHLNIRMENSTLHEKAENEEQKN